jgi:23S rRNA pseudouridine2605 synthase
MTETPPTGEKLQKILASRGMGSRREIERWIEDGRVVVNGKTANLGDRAQPDDRIEVDKKNVDLKAQTHRVLIYNKPEGEVATRKDPEGRPTVFDRLPRLNSQRWINVGRLDINTSGLMLFTTDGELANKLMHPSSNIDREYLVRVFGEVTDEIVQRLLSGVELEDGPARFSDVVENEEDSGQNRWFTVCLMEGRNREVRRLWESQDVKVNRLKRVRFGPVFLPSFLRAGQWVDMDVAETKSLYRQCGLRAPELNMRQPRERVKSKRQEEKLRSGGRSANRH